jgi:hypothetical protein
MEKQNLKDDEAEQQRLWKKRSRDKQTILSHEEVIERENIALQHCSEQQKDEVIKNFETIMSDLTHNFCSRCKRVGLNLKMAKVTGGISLCTSCSSNPDVDLVEENLLPIWTEDDGNVRYDIPEELSCLQEGEKLLIQMVSPYVPLVHIKNGTLGLKGHVCSFPQRIGDVCTTLPRLPTEAKFVKMIRHFKGEDGHFGVKSFIVRKDVVLRALRWLVKYNVVYRDNVKIEEENLNWMGEECELELPSADISRPEELVDQNITLEDLGPAPAQCLPNCDAEDEVDELQTCGIHTEDETTPMSNIDEQIANIGRSMSSNTSSASWPYVSPNPVNEYDFSEKIFCKAFPWLFPGGVGDINDYRRTRISVGDWAERMLHYQDGRFAEDKMWCFFCLNYVTRRRNQSSGRFFCDGFDKDAPENIEELQEKLCKGQTSFLDKITYYSKHVKGGSGYWRQKRSELYLEMKRNHERILQSSMDMCQSWHGNCDFQILLYDCDPLSPDPAEIARVTDYVVAYACKGNATLAEEKNQLKSLCLK